MRRCLGFIAVLLTLSILIIPISAEGTFEPSKTSSASFIHDMTKVLYYSSMTSTINGTFVTEIGIPLYEMSTVVNGFYSIGTQFHPTSGAFDTLSKYTFVLTLVPSAGNDFVTNRTDIYSLWCSTLDNRNYPIVSEASGIAYSPEITRDSNGAITFRFDNISFNDFMNKPYLYMQTDINNVTWYSESENGVPYAKFYMMNIYFGLTSEFDNEKYSKEVVSKLDDIERELEGTNEKLDDVKDSIDSSNEKLDGIQDTLDNQIDNEIDRAESEGNDTNAEAEEALGDLPDFSESYNNILNNLSSVLYDMNIQSYIDLPNGNVNILGVNFDIWGGVSEVDFSSFLADDNIQTIIIIGKGISVLGCMATSIYWAFKIKEWITANDEVSTPEIPFLPGGGKY